MMGVMSDGVTGSALQEYGCIENIESIFRLEFKFGSLLLLQISVDDSEMKVTNDRFKSW